MSNKSSDDSNQISIDIDIKHPLGNLLKDLLNDFRVITDDLIVKMEVDEYDFYRAVFALQIFWIAKQADPDGFKLAKDENPEYFNETDMFSEAKAGLLFFTESKLKLTTDQSIRLALGVVTTESSILDLFTINKLGDEDSIVNQNKINELYSSIIKNIPLATGIISAVIQDIETKNNFQGQSVSNIHIKGGQARADKFRVKKEQAFKMFKEGKYYSYAECARDIYKELEVKNPNTISNWLSKMAKMKD